MSLFLRPSASFFSYDPFFDDDSSLWRQHLLEQHQLLQDQIDQHNQLQQQKQLQNKDNKELPSSSSSPSSSTAMTKPDKDNTQMSMRKPKRSTFTSLSNIKCDAIENDNQFIINAEIPGIPQENLSVTLDNGVINISGEKKDSYDNEKKDEKTGKTIFHHVERSYGKFSRSFPLPTACLTEVDKANVTYNDNGVLNIIIPKSEQQNIPTKRTLSIQKMSKQEKEAKENQ